MTPRSVASKTNLEKLASWTMLVVRGDGEGDG